MEYIVFFLLGVTTGVGITHIIFPRLKILYKENTTMQNMDANHPANQQAPQPLLSRVKPKKPEHNVVVYIEDNREYTTFIAKIDNTLTASGQYFLTYGLRDMLNGHYLVTYGEGLPTNAKNYIEALATTHLSKTLVTDNADYHISFEIHQNVSLLGITDSVVHSQ